MRTKLLTFLFPLLLALFLVAIYSTTSPSSSSQPSPSLSPSPTITPSSSPSPSSSSTPRPTSATKIKLEEPVPQFRERITKKLFGTYITPATSPVQPERFTGYHTGVDVEFADITDTVPVKAVADGTIRYTGTVSGYGGVIIIKHTTNNQTFNALYGHLAPNSLGRVGSAVKAGQQIAVLGKDKSSETDGERRHLHFAIIRQDRLEFKGYVPTREALSAWQDPLELFQ